MYDGVVLDRYGTSGGYTPVSQQEEDLEEAVPLTYVWSVAIVHWGLGAKGNEKNILAWGYGDEAMRHTKVCH